MVNYRMFKAAKDEGAEDTIVNGVSQELLSNLRVGDSVGIESEEDSLTVTYYKVSSRTFYEDEERPLCDVVVEEECD